MNEEIEKSIIKLASFLAPTAIRDDYKTFKQIHEVLCLINEGLKGGQSK